MATNIVRKPLPSGTIPEVLGGKVEIAPELKQPQSNQPSKKLEELLQAFKRRDNSFAGIDYCETDIASLVEYVGNQEQGCYDHSRIGPYIGNLISNLTEKNEKVGKRTIIEIPVNKIDAFGKGCNKFDVVKIGVNYGNDVFSLAKNGNLLYVEQCNGARFAQLIGYDGNVKVVAAEEVNGAYFANGAKNAGIIAAKKVNGTDFARGAGSDHGKIDSIVTGIVTGNNFAKSVGDDYGKVGIIAAKEVRCDKFANEAGSHDGEVEKILADTVHSETDFATCAGHYDGKIGIIAAREIFTNNFANLLNSKILSMVKIWKGPEAEMEYLNTLFPIVTELGTYGLDYRDLLKTN